jgi:uncharacterized membrane protein YfcA
MMELAMLGLGVATGTLGTMIGAGGGFILVPILLVLFPEDKPDMITAVSLAIIFCNASVGSFSYWRQGRVDLKSAAIFSIASFPGVLLGTWLTQRVDRSTFLPAFGAALVLISTFLLLRKGIAQSMLGKANTRRHIVDSEGKVHDFGFDIRIGTGLSVLVGVLSSFLGIGGGVVHVPALVHWLNFPVHLATATSHVIVALTALVATASHYANGSLAEGFSRTYLLYLAPGVILGAPIGARLSAKVKDSYILKGLAMAMLLVGVRLMFAA